MYPLVTVKNAYTAQYENPIELQAGDEVILGPMENEEKWPGWIWASLGEKSGWIPVQIVEESDKAGMGRIREAYSARELSARPGEGLLVHKRLNGWSWAEKTVTGEIGWIPNENLAG